MGIFFSTSLKATILSVVKTQDEAAKAPRLIKA